MVKPRAPRPPFRSAPPARSPAFEARYPTLAERLRLHRASLEAQSARDAAGDEGKRRP